MSAEELQFLPQERGSDRIAKQMAGIPVPPGVEEIVPVVHWEVKVVSQERVQQWVVEFFFYEHAPVPQFLEETVDVKLVQQERE